MFRALFSTSTACVLWGGAAWFIAAQFTDDDRLRWAATAVAVVLCLLETVKLIRSPRLRWWIAAPVLLVLFSALWGGIAWLFLRLFSDTLGTTVAAVVAAAVVVYGLFQRWLRRRLLWPLLTLALLAWATVMRFGAGRAVFWGAIGWWLAQPLGEQVRETGPLLLMLLGLLLGLFGNLAAGVGMGTALAASGVGPALLWWLVPLGLAASIGPFRAYRRQLLGWWRHPSYLTCFLREEPDIGVSLVDGFAVLAGLAPLIALAGAEAPDVPTVLAAAALSALHWYLLAESGRLTRQTRQEVRLASGIWAVGLTVLAVGPMGEWLIQVWRDHVFLHDHSVAVAVSGAYAAFLLQLAHTATLSRFATDYAGPRLRLALAAGYGFFPGPALALFLAVVHHPDARLRQAALWLVAAMSALCVLLVRRTGLVQQRLDASLYVRATPMHRYRMQRAWLHDAIADRGGYPDFTLPRTLIKEGLEQARGNRSAPPERIARRWRAPGSAGVRLDEWVISWIDDAAELLKEAEACARRRLSGTELTKYRAGQRLIDGFCARGLGEVYQVLGFREEAAASFRQAARIWEAAGERDLAADSRVSSSLAGSLTPEKSLPTLAPILGDQAVLPLLRRRALLLTGAFHLRLGRQDAAKEAFGQADDTAVSQNDLRTMDRLNGKFEGRAFTLSVMLMPRTDFWILSAVEQLSPGALRGPEPETVEDDVPPPMLQLDYALAGLPEPVMSQVRSAVRNWQTRRYGRVVRQVGKASRTLEELGLVPMAFWLCGAFGLALRGIDPRSARTFLLHAVSHYEELRARIVDDDLRVALFEQAAAMYEAVVRLLTVESDDGGSAGGEESATLAFEIMESSGSRALTELLGSRMRVPAALADEPLIEEERAAAQRLTKARDQVRQTGLRRASVVELRSAQTELMSCWTRMLDQRNLAEYAALRAAVPAGYETVRGLLRRARTGTVLAEYLVTEESTLLFIGRADLARPEIVDIPLSRRRLDELTRDLFSSEHSARNLRYSRRGTWEDELAPLVAPLARWCAEGDTLWFVPHGPLHRIPLHALRIDAHVCVADRHPVRYTPSASTASYTVDKYDDGRTAALVFADGHTKRPLLHARQQSAEIAALYGERARLFVGREATKRHMTAALASVPRGVDVLHLACHGRFDDNQPMNSGLLMAPDRRGDARLTAADILELSLPANLVTLSACESGRNGDRPGDELMGFTRALLYAGVHSVVVGLWPMDDLSTSLLMRAFYRFRLDGMSDAAALRQAQLELRRITAADVIAHCERFAGQSRAAEATVALQVADARLRARDYRAALDGFTAVVRTQRTATRHAQRAQAGATRARLGMARGRCGTTDYAVPMFDHPYYWAPFIVVGGGS